MKRGKAERAPGERWKAPGLRDPRLLIGVLLVALSITGVVATVRAMDTTVPLYVAAREIGAGEKLDATSVRVVNAKLDGETLDYLGPGRGLPADGAAQRALRAGQLIAADDLAVKDPGDRRLMRITVEGQPPAGVEAGGRADLYASRTDVGAASDASRAPSLVLEGAEVAKVAAVPAALGGSEATSVQLLVPSGKVADVVAVLGRGFRLDVVEHPAATP